MPKGYIVILFLFLCLALSATIINVPADQATIQAGEFEQVRKMMC
jgi:hypothetical protein